ncbi:MAG: DUF4173 domain-containing protein [Myxococcaceae bacterium]|nr:DUF4173 domain-containing protein [Myxococcaceae bacterium]
MPLLTFSFLAALAALAGPEGRHRARRVWLLAVPLLALAGFVAVRSSPDLVALNVLACLALAGLLAHGFNGSIALADLKLWELVARPVQGWVLGLWAAPSVARASFDGQRAGALVKAHGGSVVRMGFITVPIVLVFAGLLGSGDPRFAKLLGETFVWFFRLNLSSFFWAGAATFVAAGLLAYALRRHTWAGPESVAPEASPFKLLGPVEGLGLVGALVALFGAFAAVQAQGFFVERAKLIPAEPGIGWGTYTREGFVQLTVAAALTLGLLVLLPAVTRLAGAADRAFRAGSTALVALTLVILGTAANRLFACEEAYGFTLIRVYGHVFVFALGGVLVWRAATLWVQPHRFAAGALACALAGLVGLNVLDPERFIVEKNLARYDAIGQLDLPYLLSLSPDALPALREGLAKRDALQGSLSLACAPRSDLEETGWQAANLARHRARAVPERCAR